LKKLCEQGVFLLWYWPSIYDISYVSTISAPVDNDLSCNHCHLTLRHCWFTIFNNVIGMDTPSDLSISRHPLHSIANTQICLVPSSLCTSWQNMIVWVPLWKGKCISVFGFNFYPAVSIRINIVPHLVLLYWGCREPIIRQLSILCMLACLCFCFGYPNTAVMLMLACLCLCCGYPNTTVMLMLVHMT